MEFQARYSAVVSEFLQIAARMGEDFGDEVQMFYKKRVIVSA